MEIPEADLLPGDNQLKALPEKWQIIIKASAAKHKPPFSNLAETEHNWCGAACKEINEKIPELKLVPEYGYYGFGYEYFGHIWLETEDGTIVDPTVQQFMTYDENDYLDDYKYFQDELGVPKLNAAQHEEQANYWVIEAHDPRRKYYFYELT